MGNFISLKNDWKSVATFTGSTNCVEEQECEITSKMFAEKPSFLKKYNVHSVTFYNANHDFIKKDH